MIKVFCMVLLLVFNGCDNHKSYDYIERHLDESIANDTIPYELYEKYEKEFIS